MENAKQAYARHGSGSTATFLTRNVIRHTIPDVVSVYVDIACLAWARRSAQRNADDFFGAVVHERFLQGSKKPRGPARCQKFTEQKASFPSADLSLVCAAMDLQPPSVLAQLPRPLQSLTGRTQIGDVFSLAESKKRKRYEVAVAIDGEAVNIYNVGILSAMYWGSFLAERLVLGPISKTRHLLCCSTAIIIFLSPMLGASQGPIDFSCQATDILRS